MDRSFQEVFPGLHGDREVQGLLPLMDVSSIRYSRDKKSLLIFTRVKRLVGRELLDRVEKLLDKQVLQDYGNELHSRICEEYILPDSYRLADVISEYKDTLLKEAASGSPISERLLKRSAIEVDEESLTLTVDDYPIAHSLERGWTERIIRILAERFLRDASVRIAYRKPKEHVFLIDDGTANEPVNAAAEEKNESVSAASVSGSANTAAPDRSPESSGADAKKNPAPKKPRSVKKDSEAAASPCAAKKELNRAQSGKQTGSVKAPKPVVYSDDPDVIYGRKFTDEVRRIASYDASEEGSMVIAGDIMESEMRELKSKTRCLITLSVTDYTDSISIKLFVPSEQAEEIFGKLKKGTIKVKGNAEYDSFDREIGILHVQGIMKSNAVFEEKREDHATVKRVELHLHTKASENDAVTDVTDMIAAAKHFGHKAMAVTDHGCVYAFTDAFHAVGKDDFKVIYGMEGYLVDDIQRNVVNPQNTPLSAPCVVFDLETTGLSPVRNKIIEIGAVKVEGGKVVDRFSTFVDPEVPIPFRIESLTSINDSMVKGAPKEKEALEALMKFSEGCYLVAHNAEFDISFVNEGLKRIGYSHEPFTYADTLGISRVLLPQLSRYGLDPVAKELDVVLEHHHRAVDDAECTAFIWLKLQSRLEARNLHTLQEVHDAVTPDENAIKKMRTNHVILLAANETGRINLYHLVSESSLKYFRRRPRIPKSLLQKYREGLIIGSACSAGELFEAVLEGKQDEEIARIVNFYDYLEIQPIGNNRYLIAEDNDVRSDEDLKELNRRIVRLGEQYQKPVCATCDAHFLDPEDSIYRQILQAGCGYKETEDQPPLYFRTTEEMLAEFDYLGADKAYEVVVTNTNLIADRIERIAPVRPDKCPPVIENSDEDLRTACYKKARELYGDPLPEIVEKRLERELRAIISNGYAVMYMIAQKLVQKSVNDGYLVGSRGSVGSSLAATMSGITEVNALPPHYRCPSCRYSDFDSELVKKYSDNTGADMPDCNCPKCGAKMVKDGFNIPFETFMGFKGNKEPDIDLNFSGEYQAKAHAYTEVIFGKGQTFKAGTIGTVAEKTAIGYVLHYCEENAIQKRRCEIKRIAHHLEGVRRTSGQHPGGIIVLPFGEDINSFTPVQHPANDENTSIITTHFDYHSIDSNLLKLDILGHDDPTMIRMLQDLTGRDPREFPLSTPEVMSLFKDTSALGVTPEEIRGCPMGALGLPEFGTDNAINMLLETKPQYVSDLIRISGLAHGTNVWHGNAQTLIEEGKCTIATAVCTRDDIMVYLIDRGIENERAFKIMEDVRKGRVAKKKSDNWAEWKEDMMQHGVPDWYIWSCEHIEYMFPKAHAAAYVMMALRIAYCKVFYPLAYYCAYFSIRASGFNYELMCLGKEELERNMDEYEKKEKMSAKEEDVYRDMRIVQEMYARGFSFTPIDIYKAQSTRFMIMDDRHLMPSLTSIDGMGTIAADTVVEAVKTGRPFTSLDNFRQRTKVSQTLIDKMQKLHILDGLPADDQFSLFDLGV